VSRCSVPDAVDAQSANPRLCEVDRFVWKSGDKVWVSSCVCVCVCGLGGVGE
jgi:hypothetical protein